MGSHPYAYLHYGYNLGGGGTPWNISELPSDEDYPEWIPSWIDPFEAADIVREQCYYDLVEERLLAEVGGFRERRTDHDKSGYYMRRHAALKRVGIELSGHGYMPDSEIGGYVLHIYETSVQPLDPAYAVDFASLEHRRVEEGWDARLDQAMSALQITCTQPAGWLLVASYT